MSLTTEFTVDTSEHPWTEIGPPTHILPSLPDPAAGERT